MEKTNEVFNLGDKVYAVDYDDFATYFSDKYEEEWDNVETYKKPFHTIIDVDNPRKYNYYLSYPEYGLRLEEGEYSFVSKDYKKCIDFIIKKKQEIINKKEEEIHELQKEY